MKLIQLLHSLILVISVASFSLLAQEDSEALSETYEGVWEAKFEGSEEIVYLIIKPENQASFFFSFTDDNIVYQANWELNTLAEPKLKVSSTIGHSFEISRGATNYQVNWSRPSGLSSQGTVISVPDSEVGKLTVSPDEVGRQNTTLANAEGFFGTWEIQNEGSAPFYIVVEDNRTAGASYALSKYGARGLRGRWVKRGDELHIQWDSGHYSILKELPTKYESLFYQPGEALNSETSGVTTLAARVDIRSTGAWGAQYDATKATYATSISAFRKRSQARTFYRGKWDVVDADGNLKETIDFGRFQDVDSNRESGIDGSWRISSDFSQITWEDGLRAMVQPVEDAFTISIFLPDQALDGTPYKYFSLIPHDPEKIAEYIEKRTESSDRLREYLEDEARNAERRRARDGWFNFWPFN